VRQAHARLRLSHLSDAAGRDTIASAGDDKSEMTMSVRSIALRSHYCLAAATLCLANASLLAAPLAQAQSVEEFYRKTPVQLLIGFPVANAYDTYGRIVARHLGKHIPGNPSVVPINRPGAGSLTAANFLYHAAPKDGSTIAHFNRSIPLEPLMGNAAAKFDGRRFTWLGSVGNEVSVCVGWHTAAVKTWNDMLSKEFVAGAAGLGADTGVFPTVLKNLFGAKIKIITGFPGGAEMSLAMERGEIDGRCGWSWSGVKSSKPEWISGKQINVLLQLGLQKSAELPDVPLIMDQAKSDDQRQILRLIFSRQEFAWPFAAPPGIPADRAQALRNAFDATLKDPEFLEDAKKTQIDVNPISASAVERLIGELYAAPEPVLAKLRSVLNVQ
jgi:tripartite-type tricarboxylate transporter receptor subunit TctC